VIHLVAKTTPNVNAINDMLGTQTNQSMEFLEQSAMVHTFWCIAMPCGKILLKTILDSGAGYITLSDDDWMVVSGNTHHWHLIAKHLLSHSSLNVKKFGTLLIQTYPQIFTGLSTVSSGNGVLALRIT
jgi:hypothetical protein